MSNTPSEGTMTEMERLAERVEAATGPDRDIDLLIAKTRLDKPLPDACKKIDGHLAWAGPWAFNLPAYTASLDAAMTLLSEGSEIDLTNLYGVARAHVDMAGEYGGFHGEHLGGSLALALCAAALRARSQGETR